MSPALSAAVTAARQKATRVGPLHALWDVIFDAEAWAAGKETLVDWGQGEAGEQRLIAALKR